MSRPKPRRSRKNGAPDISRRDIRMIAAEIGAAERTVQRWVDEPDGVNPVTGYACRAALDILGIESPHAAA